MCRLESALRIGNKLRLVAALVAADGQLAEAPPYALRRDGRVVRCGQSSCLVERAQFAAQREQPLELVLLLEESIFLRPLYQAIQNALAEFLAALPRDARVRWGTFGSQVTLAPRSRPAAELRGDRSFYRATDGIEVHLIEALRAAQQALTSAAVDRPLPPRRVIVVLGSGLDESPLPRYFAALGSELAQSGIVVFPVALLPHGSRLWLLNLSELAWRTQGTFRWARGGGAGETPLAVALAAEFLTLAKELSETEILWFQGDELTPALRGLRPELGLDCGASFAAAQPIPRLNVPRRWGVRTLLSVLLCLMLTGGLWHLLARKSELALD